MTGNPGLATLTPREIDENELREAIKVANLPTLLMVMFQLSGDNRWLNDPYRPSRTKGMSDNDDGGFSVEIQEEIREAAFQILMDWSRGKEIAHVLPDEDLLVEMISTCMGEQVPEEFGPMFSEDMRAVIEGGRPQTPIENAEDFSVIIIGAGISGITAAYELKAVGVDVTIFEKNNEVGGTWWENIYPGCGVDTPSYVYTLSYQPREWSTYYGKRDEVLAYIKDVAKNNGIVDLIQYETEVTSAVFDEQSQRWNVVTRAKDGSTSEHSANVVITAVGQLNRPAVPQIEGSDVFAGRAFHSAEWPEDLDITGLRVGVVGSGASAMQIVPAIADKVEQLSVFQRSPQWVAPSFNYTEQVPERVHWLLREIPNYYLWYRLRLSWLVNDRLHPALFIDPEWEHPERSVNVINDGHRRALSRYIQSELEGRDDLIEKALPTYPPFGKRMLLDNGWYKALRKPNVELITDGIAKLDETGAITTSGEHFELDVIVYATGFEAKKQLHPMDIRGRGGVSIRDIWGDEDARAYLGMTVPDFPNLLVMYGPNINLGHGGSYMFAGECQARYITDLCRNLIESGSSTFEVRRDVHDDYNARVDEEHSKMIWSHKGMDTWYRNANGRIVTNSPWRVVDYWQFTREANPADFVFESAVDSNELVSSER